MQRAARLALFYFVLSVIAVPLSLLLSFPRYPTSPLGWLAFVALPIPLTIAGEWLFQYRPSKLLRPIDTWATQVEQSPHRLAIVISVIAASGALGLGILWLGSLALP
jgi:hypothetical protein